MPPSPFWDALSTTKMNSNSTKNQRKQPLENWNARHFFERICGNYFQKISEFEGLYFMKADCPGSVKCRAMGVF
jgi:hypothetical protein